MFIERSNNTKHICMYIYMKEHYYEAYNYIYIDIYISMYDGSSNKNYLYENPIYVYIYVYIYIVNK